MQDKEQVALQAQTRSSADVCKCIEISSWFLSKSSAAAAAAVQVAVNLRSWINQYTSGSPGFSSGSVQLKVHSIL